MIEGAGDMPSVREVDGKVVTVDAPLNPERRGERGVGGGGRRVSRGQRSHNLQYGVSCKGMN